MKPLIQAKSAKKCYINGNRKKYALGGITLDIHEGEVLGLLGINGAGKTTLSSILAGLHPLTDGDIHFQGRSIYEDIVSYRKNVGFCPQKPNLDLSLSLTDNQTHLSLIHISEPTRPY